MRLKFRSKDTMARYILKNKDIDVLSFEVVTKEIKSALSHSIDFTQKIENIRILNAHLLPLNLNEIELNLSLWIKERKIPENREFVENIVATYSENGKEQLMDYIDISLALSLNDSFWIVPTDKNYKWKDYNLYDNAFNEILERVAFGEELQAIQGFTSSPEYTTNGMLKKCWHRENNQIYLYKGSSTEYANGGKEAFSEFYMAQVAEIMGFEYVPYDLKEFHNQIVSSCPIFTNENEGYAPMYKIFKNKEYKLFKKAELINAIAEFYAPKKLQDLMLFDALILNPDRHLGNFGMIIDNNTNELLRPAPIFDNGYSMMNFLTLDELKNIKNSKIEKISSFGYSFDEQIKEAVQTRHIPNLTKLTHFQFKRHKALNLSDEWLKPIEAHIQERAKLAIKLCKAKELDTIAFKHKELEKEIKYYSEHKNSFYPDAKKASEDKIISLCVELNTNGEIISPKDLEVFLNIVKERNSGRSL